MKATSLESPNLPAAQRVEELGRIIMAYSEVTERLQQSHDQLKQQVEHLRVELSEKNRLLERRNRLAALGEMAAGMAHEIRNPLGGIQLYASLVAKDVADHPATVELVNKISSGVKRLEMIVSQVLHFTREIRAASIPTDLAETIAQAIELAAAQRDGRMRITIDGPERLPVCADPVLLCQAILNLALNAIEAMHGHGELRISYGPPARESSDVRQFRLVIEDTGPGIPADVIDRIFNPFFTTKETGTGLGLAIVHRIVEAHDGTITAGNTRHADAVTGARFEIRI